MPRTLVLGNGSLWVGWDQDARIADLTWPHIGLDNHSLGRRSHLGLVLNGTTLWVDQTTFELELGYEEGVPITRVVATHLDLGLRIVMTGALLPDDPVLLRRLTIENLTQKERSVQVLLHHDFDIGEGTSGITAHYDPATTALIHYRRQVYALISGKVSDQVGVTGYCCEHRTAHDGLGARGRVTHLGALDGNPISLGAVDSCVSFAMEIPAGAKAHADTWLVLGRRYPDIVTLQRMILERGPDQLFESVRARAKIEGFVPSSVTSSLSPPHTALHQRSLFVLQAMSDREGGILAANDSDILNPGRESYAYVWMRDAALIADALSKAGHSGPARRFFVFCDRHLPSHGAFLHRYHADGSFASSWLPWVQEGAPAWPIQEDETALVLWALARHVERENDGFLARRLFPRLVRRSAQFLVSYRDPITKLPLPSFDLWEERRAIHTFTVASVIAGLRGAAKIAERLEEHGCVREWTQAADEVDHALEHHLFHHEAGRYARAAYPGQSGLWLDTTCDASLYGLHSLGVRAKDHERLRSTLEAVSQRLSVDPPIGGVARYESDAYCRNSELSASVPGNPWLICTLWRACFRLAAPMSPQDLEGALRDINWAEAQANPAGLLPEQIDALSGQVLSVSPLAWSHAAFLEATLALAEHRIHDREIVPVPNNEPLG